MSQLTKRSIGLIYRFIRQAVQEVMVMKLNQENGIDGKMFQDEWVLPSKRMPDNPYYTTEKWKNFKKKQIFFGQDDGIPVYLKSNNSMKALYIVSCVLMVFCGYGAITGLLDGHVFPKKRAE